MGNDDTRDIAMQARADVERALDEIRNLTRSVDKLRDENTAQHFEARALINDGLAKVHTRLNTLIAGGWAMAVGLISYLLAFGPPWVTHAQLKEVLEHVLQHVN